MLEVQFNVILSSYDIIGHQILTWNQSQHKTAYLNPGEVIVWAVVLHMCRWAAIRKFVR